MACVISRGPEYWCWRDISCCDCCWGSSECSENQVWGEALTCMASGFWQAVTDFNTVEYCIFFLAFPSFCFAVLLPCHFCPGTLHIAMQVLYDINGVSSPFSLSWNKVLLRCPDWLQTRSPLSFAPSSESYRCVLSQKYKRAKGILLGPFLRGNRAFCVGSLLWYFLRGSLPLSEALWRGWLVCVLRFQMLGLGGCRASLGTPGRTSFPSGLDDHGARLPWIFSITDWNGSLFVKESFIGEKFYHKHSVV